MTILNKDEYDFALEELRDGVKFEVLDDGQLNAIDQLTLNEIIEHINNIIETQFNTTDDHYKQYITETFFANHNTLLAVWNNSLRLAMNNILNSSYDSHQDLNDYVNWALNTFGFINQLTTEISDENEDIKNLLKNIITEFKDILNNIDNMYVAEYITITKKKVDEEIRNTATHNYHDDDSVAGATAAEKAYSYDLHSRIFSGVDNPLMDRLTELLNTDIKEFKKEVEESFNQYKTVNYAYNTIAQAKEGQTVTIASVEEAKAIVEQGGMSEVAKHVTDGTSGKLIAQTSPQDYFQHIYKY